MQHSLWRLRGAPLAVDAGGAGGPADEDEAAVALVHDLPVVADLPDVGAVLVEAHAAHQQHLAVVDETREGAEHCKQRKIGSQIRKSQSQHFNI